MKTSIVLLALATATLAAILPTGNKHIIKTPISRSNNEKKGDPPHWFDYINSYGDIYDSDERLQLRNYDDDYYSNSEDVSEDNSGDPDYIGYTDPPEDDWSSDDPAESNEVPDQSKEDPVDTDDRVDDIKEMLEAIKSMIDAMCRLQEILNQQWSDMFKNGGSDEEYDESPEGKQWKLKKRSLADLLAVEGIEEILKMIADMYNNAMNPGGSGEENGESAEGPQWMLKKRSLEDLLAAVDIAEILQIIADMFI